MFDPKKLIDKLPRFDRDKPFRYLGRRVVQAMAEAATANLLLGQRTAPGRYLVVRLVPDEDEKERWEAEYAESRRAIVQEVTREAATRDIRLRSSAEVDLLVVTDAEAARGEAERVLSTVLDETEVAAHYARLQEERELVLPRRLRILHIESEPAEAQIYLDDRPAGVTPCRVEDLPEGEHRLVLSRPGFLPHEETFRVEPGRAGQRLRHRVVLAAEPAMGVLEVRTFPPRARVTVAGETRDSPARWRLPVGRVPVRVELEDFAPQSLEVEVPETREDRPHVCQIRLEYVGPGREEVVGRLQVFRPSGRREAAPADPSSQRIRSFFGDVSTDEPVARAADPVEDPGELLGERPLRRGILLIGREDPGSPFVPDIKLFDPENSVSRGCHAWLWVYADTSTGATYNTFLIGNNSLAGIRVDGTLVMESRRLADDSVIEIGNFRMRLVKERPQARVEFGF